MSEPESTATKVEDKPPSEATAGAGNPQAAPKKLKQMRLPFQVLPKNAPKPTVDAPTKDETKKKRKNSTDADKITPSKKEKVDADGDKPDEIQDENKEDVGASTKEEGGKKRAVLTTISSPADAKKRTTLQPAGSPVKMAKTEEDSSDTEPKESPAKKLKTEATSASPAPSAKKRVNLVPVSKEKSVEKSEAPTTPITKAKEALNSSSSPSMSPSVLSFRKRKIGMEKAKMVVSIQEFNDDMEAAVAKKEFLIAAEIKAKVDSLVGQKEKLEKALNKADEDPAAFNAVWDELQEAKSTPKAVTVKAETPTTAAPSTPEAPKPAKKMTPRQEAKKKEAAEKKEKEKLEKEQKKKEELEKKELEKKRKEAEKEAEKRKKEAEREAEKKRKEEEKKLKAELKEFEKQRKEEAKVREKEAKEQEKKQKEEAKLKEKEAKEAERLRKEEDKRKQEEAEKAKKEKEKKHFSKFFIKKAEGSDKPKESDSKDNSSEVDKNTSYQFRVKRDMKLAPITRRRLDNNDKTSLDEALGKNFNLDAVDKVQILNNLKKRSYPRTWPPEDKKVDDDEVEVIEEDEDDLDMDQDTELEAIDDVKPRKVKAKLLQFTENERPAYFGTWSKKPQVASARNPLGKEADLDYEYDSGEDWEEEEQGESLSDEEKDKEEDDEDDDEDEEDDGFFVAHGVLDKDEMMLDDSEDEEDADYDPQARPKTQGEFDDELEVAKQKMKAEAFEAEYNRNKKKVGKLKPKVFGCLWVHEDRESVAYEQLLKILKPNRCISFSKGPIVTSAPASALDEETDTPAAPKETPTSAKKARVFPEEAYPDLIKLVHVNTHSKQFLSKEFSAFWAKKSGNNSENPSEATPTSRGGSDSIPLTKILAALNEIATYSRYTEPGPMQNKTCWVVQQEFLEMHELTPNVPNDWQYVLEPPSKPTPNVPTPTENPAPSPAVNTIKNAFTATPKRKENKTETKVDSSPKTVNTIAVKRKEKTETKTENGAKIATPKRKGLETKTENSPKVNTIQAAFSNIAVKRKPKPSTEPKPATTEPKVVEVVDLVEDDEKKSETELKPVEDKKESSD